MNKDIYAIIDRLKEIERNPKQSVLQAIKETGKKAVGVFPIYTPEELVYAAGALPVSLWGGKRTGALADKYLQSFCCSIMKANTEQSLRGDYDMLSAVLITTYCDTLKCITENWKAAVPHLNPIPIVYPQNRKTEAGKRFFREELQRVLGELEKNLYVKVTEQELDEAMQVYETYRETMRRFTEAITDFPQTFDAATRHQIIKAAGFMDKKEYTKLIQQMLLLLKTEEKEPKAEKKVIFTGLLAEPVEMLDLFAENGICVAADDLAQESRQFRVRAPETGSCFERMAARLAMQDGCTFLYDSQKTRGERLIQMVKEKKADAVIFFQLKFCDPEEFDYPIVKKELEAAGIPLLRLEFEQQMESVEQLRTRIQSFAEMLI